MKWWEKSIRTLGKAVVVLLVGVFTVIVFFPGLFTKYLQTYANRKYLIPLGLRVSYSGFGGDFFGAFRFSDISLAARNGAFTLRAENALMNIDFLRLLRRDLSFDEVSLGSLHLEISEFDSARTTERIAIERLPWVSIKQLSIKEGAVSQRDSEFWFQIAGNLDMSDQISIGDAQLVLTHPRLSDTLRFTADQFTFDGQQISIVGGDINYQENHAIVSGKVAVIPRMDMDLYVASDRFTQPENLPDWLNVQSIEGKLVGTPDSLGCNLSLGMEVNGRPLDQALIDLSLVGEQIHLHKGALARGPQAIEASGDVHLGGRLSLNASFLNTQLDAFFPQFPEIHLHGNAGITAFWQEGAFDSVALVLALHRLEYQGNTLHAVHGQVGMKDGIWTITDSTSFRYAESGIQLWGSIDAGREMLDLEVYLQSDSISGLLSSFDWPPIEAQANGQVWVNGSRKDPSLTGAVMLKSTGYQRFRIGQAFIQFILDSTFTRPQGRLYASTGDLDLFGIPAEGGEAEFIFQGDTIFASTLRLYQGLERLSTYGYLTLTSPFEIVLDTLAAWRNTENLTSGRIRVSGTGEGANVSPVRFEVASGSMTVSGDWATGENFAFQTHVDDVDLERLLRFFGKPPRIRGHISANATVSNQYGRLAVTGILDGTSGEFDRIPFDQMHSEFDLHNNVLTIRDLIWQNREGKLTATGNLTYSLNESQFGGLGSLDSLNLRGRFDGYQFHDLQPHLPWRYATYGDMSGTIMVHGPVESPVYEAELSAADPRFDRLTGELIKGRLRYEKEQLQFSDLMLKTPAGIYTGGGIIPADLRPTAGVLDVLMDAPVNLAFHGTTAQLDFFTPYFDDIDSLNGEFDIDLSLTGTFSRLIRNGQLTARNGTVELFVMENPITKINGEVVMEDNQLRIVRFEGRTPHRRLGKDDSRLTLAGSMDMTRFFHPVFNVKGSGEHTYFSLPLREIEIVGSPTFSVTGRDTVLFSCDFVPDPGQAFFRMEFTGPESYVLKKPDEGTIMMYEIRVPFYSGAIVENSDVNNAEIEGEIALTRVGSEDWSYAGNIDIITGDLYYYGRDWVIDEGSITLDPTNLNESRIYIRATTQEIFPAYGLEEPVDITLVFTGTLEEPQYSWEYPPSLPITESDLFQLLALGKEPEKEYDPAVTAGLSLTNIVLRRFEENARLVSGLDQFRIQTSSPRTIIPEPQEVRFHIGKRLSPRLYVGVQADPTLSFNQYQIAYRLSRRMTPIGSVDQSLVGSVDENGLYQVKYRLKLRY